MKHPRQIVERMNLELGLAETIRDVEFYAARRLVERDLATGTKSTMTPEPRVRASGRMVR